MSTNNNVNCVGYNSTTPIVYFHPSLWGVQFQHFVPLDQETQLQKEQEVEQLKEEVRKKLLSITKKSLEELDFVDAIERLGLAYHFEQEIEDALHQVHEHYHQLCVEDDLYHVSTRFRILRQHGFYVPCDVFKKFKEEKKGFKGCTLNDVRGMLSLYEACHVRVHGDDILDEAYVFTTTHLKSLVEEGDNKLLSSPLGEQVAHALHQPLHKGFVRLESRHYISFYEQDASHNTTLLKLAKLDFNLLQSMHKKELHTLSSWWEDLFSKAPFTRDRLVEAYFWVLGFYYEPKYGLARITFMKMFMIIQVFDDIFDAYGTYEILKLFVEAVERWNYDYVAQLPKYFNSVYQILLETMDQVSKETAEDGAPYIVSYLKTQMDLTCQKWLQEAQWLSQKIIPKYDEYMEVTTISIGSKIGIISSYLRMGPIATKESFEWFVQEPMPKLVQAAANILRLMNDLASTKIEQNSREHVVSSIQCYMKEHDIFDEEIVYRLIEKQVEDEWKTINEGMLQPYKMPKPLLNSLLNQSRACDIFYKGRTDGYTVVNEIIQEKIAKVLIHPV